MIHEIDETLRAIVRREVVNGSDVEVLFEAPTKEWASRRNTPTIDIYLYDIREDLKRRHSGLIPRRDAEGREVGKMPAPRWFKLSYLVTCWTQRPEDEHRLLSAMLACFLRKDRIPAVDLAGSLADQGWPVDVTIGLPPPEDRALSDVWSALGGELKPSLDLVMSVPVDLDRFRVAAPLVTEEPRFRFGDGADTQETPRRRRVRRPASAPTGVLVPGGRRVALRGPDAARAAGAGDATGAPGDAEEAELSAAAAAAAAIPEETIHVSGEPGKPGRIFRVRGTTDR